MAFKMMRWAIKIALFLALLVLAGTTTAQAQQTFCDRLRFYCVEVPKGWAVLDGEKGMDALIVGPGGKSRGWITLGTQDINASLDPEAGEFGDDDSIFGKRYVTLDGFRCLTFGVVRSRTANIENYLQCRFAVPTAGLRLTFVLSSVSVPAQEKALEAVYWRIANSIRWRSNLRPY